MGYISAPELDQFLRQADFVSILCGFEALKICKFTEGDIMAIRQKRLIMIGFGGAAFVARQSYQRWRRTELGRLQNHSQLVTTQQGAIEYDEVGEGAAVIILHGSPGGYDQGITLARLVNASGFRCLGISRPGYLRTPLTTGKTPAEQADAYVALLDALGIKQAAVIGLSGGGPSALQFALRHPDRCWALVMLAAVSQRWNTIEEAERAAPLMHLLNKLIQTDFTSNIMALVAQRWPELLVPFAIDNPEHQPLVSGQGPKLELMADMVNSCHLFNDRYDGFENDMQQFDRLPLYPLADIRTPTLILHGTADQNVPFSHAEFVAQTVPQATLKAFEDAIHGVFVTHQEEVTAELTAFLTTHRPL